MVRKIKKAFPKLLHNYFKKKLKKNINLNQFFYCFVIVMDSKSWIIKKILADFYELQKECRKFLRINKFKKKVPELLKQRKLRKFSRIKIHDILWNFLRKLFIIPLLLNRYNPLYEFLECSSIPLASESRKFKELWIKKRSGGRHIDGICMNFCCCCCRR